jgi:hypothetical protein
MISKKNSTTQKKMNQKEIIEMIQEEIQRLKSLDYPIIFLREKKLTPI